MLSLPIESHQFNDLLKLYEEYLNILGYAHVTVKSWPIHAREFMHFLESKGIRDIVYVKSRHVTEFATYIKHRPNQRNMTKSLSSSSINKTFNSVNAFLQFLHKTANIKIKSAAKRETVSIAEREILSVDEITQLREATFLPHRENTKAIGLRDRAILAIFYGCGLRRNEGKHLSIADIDLKKEVVLVRKGKGNKQRYVPIVATHLDDIKNYLTEGREWFLQKHTTNAKWFVNQINIKDNADHKAFFVSQRGNSVNEFYQRLQQMKSRAGLKKTLTPHILRHSIATHLFQNGMNIEHISKFLGHGSLASTQLYTHIHEYD